RTADLGVAVHAGPDLGMRQPKLSTPQLPRRTSLGQEPNGDHGDIRLVRPDPLRLVGRPAGGLRPQDGSRLAAPSTLPRRTCRRRSSGRPRRWARVVGKTRPAWATGPLASTR